MGRKKQESFDADANVLFGGEPTPKVEEPPKPEPVPEVEEEESEEEEEEVKPEPKKLSKADLKPAAAIKVNIAEEEPPKMRRKMKRQDTAEQEDLFAPKPKDKIKDEFAEKEKKPKEEEEKIVITPAVLPVKNLRRAKFRTNKRKEREGRSQRKRLSKSNQLTYQNQNWSKSSFLSTKVQLEERRSQ